MNNENQEPMYRNNFFSVLVSLFVGGLAGAITMLLLAPQSGKRPEYKFRKRALNCVI
jgi:gas vesicle protein